eukprot:scaffold99344_cov23-Tisochrysis_lutea.AAC.1
MFMLLGDFTEDPQSQAEAGRGQASQSVPTSSLPSHDRLSSNESRTSQRPSPMPPESGQTAAARCVCARVGACAPCSSYCRKRHVLNPKCTQPSGIVWRDRGRAVPALRPWPACLLGKLSQVHNHRAGTEHSILCAAGSTPLHLA